MRLTIYQKLFQRAKEAQRDYPEYKEHCRAVLAEIYGSAKTARELGAISYAEYIDLNDETVYFANTHGIGW